MTIVDPIAGAAIPPYVPGYAPYTNITPFTYRDGITYLEKLESFQAYVNNYLVPFINTNFAELGQEFADEVNNMITTVNNALAAQSADVDQKIADLTQYVDDTMAAVVADGIQLQDPVMAGIINNSTSQSRVALENLYVSDSQLSDIPLAGPGIDPTGATDSSAAIQTILNAKPGRRFHLPFGIFLLNTGLILSKGQTIRGAGQQDWRDRTNYFGDAAYLNNANYNGTVIRYMQTTGVAITLLDTTVNSGGLEDFTLIGPGTGTSTGVVIGSAAMSVVNPTIRKVKIANFYLGFTTFNCDEGVFIGLMIRGCSTGYVADQHTNNNAFYLLDLEKCGNGVVITSTCYDNSFYSLICQGSSLIGLQISGNLNAIFNPYFEANATRDIHVLAGRGNAFYSAYLNKTGDSIMIDSGVLYTSFFGLNAGASYLINNAGSYTYIQGAIGAGQLTDTGISTVLIDGASQGTAYGNALTMSPLPALTGITLGDGTLIAKYTKIGKRLFMQLRISFGASTLLTGGNITIATLIPQPLNMPVNVIIIKASNGAAYQGMGWISSAGLVLIGIMSLTTSQMIPLTATTPITWAVGDMIGISYTVDTN